MSVKLYSSPMQSVVNNLWDQIETGGEKEPILTAKSIVKEQQNQHTRIYHKNA